MDLKNNKKPIIILLTAFIAAVNCYAQDSPAVSKGDLQFYVDYASFMGKENKSYTEFYLMFFSDQISGDASGTDSVKEFTIESAISNPLDGKTVYDKQWNTNALLPRDSTKSNRLVVYDQWAELMNPGTYNVKVKVSVQGIQKKGEAKFNLTVPEFDAGTFSISQIEFVSGVSNGVDSSPFVKGDKKVFPNPWRRYGALNSQLTFFYEVYNKPGDENIAGEYTIMDNTGKIVKKLSGIDYDKKAGNVSITHGINVSKLPTGVYNLNISVSDSYRG